jgi:uncharacterized protein YyaL (SSP411 family)
MTALGQQPLDSVASLPTSFTIEAYLQRKLQEGHRPNRLINEKSPYLLQHAFNPVDWYPWGEEAFAKAREEDKPIFLSIGYSTCYWCHVMERQVFENEEIAELMNKKLICIKVDREERPDVDRIYMTAVQTMTGSGGWPLSVFLTPELKPFFGATYLPPTEQYGRPGFPQIVKRIGELWKYDRKSLLESGEQIYQHLKNYSESQSAVAVNDSILHRCFAQLTSNYDSVYAGFGSGPKFPRPVAVNFLLRYYYRTENVVALQMALQTLHKMAEGGMYDHLGGGFHRYSVDGQWRVPHFEKMLYDQAQLIISYLEAYQITHDEFFASVARDVLNYVLRNLTSSEGGFYSAEDAESALDYSRPEEKEEGAFYLWTTSELQQHLSNDEYEIFCYYYGVNVPGNALHDPTGVFQGKNILYVANDINTTAIKFGKSPDEIKTILHSIRQKLLSLRELRPRPHLDDKIITAWNGLMISAFAKAYQVLGEQEYKTAAVRTAKFILAQLYDAQNGTLLRRYRQGEARYEGTLQDYAFFVQALIDLYESSFDLEFLEMGLTLTTKQIEVFFDSTHGGFFDTPKEVSSLILRLKEEYDGAEPTGNSIAALNLLRLAHITNSDEWRFLAQKTIEAFGARMTQVPEILPQMLVAYDWLTSAPKEIIIAGNREAEDTRNLFREVYSHFLPHRVIIFLDGSDPQKKLTSYLPVVESMTMKENKATAYICENYACQLPTTDRTVVAQLLAKKTK